MADVVAANGPNLSDRQAFPSLEIEAFPATDLDPKKAPDAPAVLLHREFSNIASKLIAFSMGASATIVKPDSDLAPPVILFSLQRALFFERWRGELSAQSLSSFSAVTGRLEITESCVLAVA